MMVIGRVNPFICLHNIRRNQKFIIIFCRSGVIQLTECSHIIQFREGLCLKNTPITDSSPESLYLAVIQRQNPFLHIFLLEHTVSASLREYQ